MNSLSEHMTHALQLPEVVAERCVHSVIEQATCQVCVDSCPHQAWQLDDDSLGLDTTRCSSCGLCAAACPEGALSHEQALEVRDLKGTPVALIACHASELQGAGVINCLHSISLTTVLRLYQQGVKAILVVSGDCDNCTHCPDIPALCLPDKLQALNHSLSQRQHPLLHYRQMPHSSWQHYQQTLPAWQATHSITRRSFFRTAAHQVGEAYTQTQQAAAFSPPGTLLPPTTQQPASLPYVPHIDAQGCNGCNACFKVCPHEALTIDATRHQYLIHAEYCTGCGLCEDLCTVAAIQIEQWTIPTVTRLDLHSTRCQRCGVPFQRPTAYTGEQQLCSVCAKVNHHSQLFQVYD